MACHLCSAKPLSQPKLNSLSIRPLVTSQNAILIKTQNVTFKKTQLQISSVSCRPFDHGLSVLTQSEYGSTRCTRVCFVVNFWYCLRNGGVEKKSITVWCRNKLVKFSLTNTQRTPRMLGNTYIWHHCKKWELYLNEDISQPKKSWCKNATTPPPTTTLSVSLRDKNDERRLHGQLWNHWWQLISGFIVPAWANGEPRFNQPSRVKTTVSAPEGQQDYLPLGASHTSSYITKHKQFVCGQKETPVKARVPL